MICFINRSTVDYDIRLQKYVQACMETDTPYIVIGWDRMRNCSKTFPNEYQYKAYAPYGNGLKSLLPLIGWVFYVLYHLFRYRKRYRVIHACNIENYLIAYPARWFGKKMVLDIYDSAESKIETRAAKKCDALILPNNNRLEQIQVKEKEIKKYLEVENVPIFHEGIVVKENPEFPETIRLSYVGVMQRGIRGIENVLSLVNEDDRFVLDIAGTGDGLDEVIKDLASKNKRIHYYGKVDYQKALELMNNSDFIVALYYLNCKSHKYASPNKYYESLYLAKPVITTKGTLVGKTVEDFDTGYTIEDTKEALAMLFKDIEQPFFRENYINKVHNCRTRWQNAYASYFQNVTKGAYLQLMRSLY